MKPFFIEQIWGLNRHESLGGWFIHSRYLPEYCRECHTTAPFLDNLFNLIKFGHFLPMFGRPGVQISCTMDYQKNWLVLNIFIMKKTCPDIQFLPNWKHSSQFSGTCPLPKTFMPIQNPDIYRVPFLVGFLVINLQGFLFFLQLLDLFLQHWNDFLISRGFFPYRLEIFFQICNFTVVDNFAEGATWK